MSGAVTGFLGPLAGTRLASGLLVGATSGVHELSRQRIKNHGQPINWRQVAKAAAVGAAFGAALTNKLPTKIFTHTYYATAKGNSIPVLLEKTTRAIDLRTAVPGIVTSVFAGAAQNALTSASGVLMPILYPVNRY